MAIKDRLPSSLLRPHAIPDLSISPLKLLREKQNGSRQKGRVRSVWLYVQRIYSLGHVTFRDGGNPQLSLSDRLEFSKRTLLY